MSALSPAVAHHRARVGAITRAVRAGERPSADLDNARRDLAWEKLAEHAESVVAGWPQPTDIQLQRIAALLSAGGVLPGDGPRPRGCKAVAERITELTSAG